MTLLGRKNGKPWEPAPLLMERTSRRALVDQNTITFYSAQAGVKGKAHRVYVNGPLLPGDSCARPQQPPELLLPPGNEGNRIHSLSELWAVWVRMKSEGAGMRSVDSRRRSQMAGYKA